MPVSLEQRVLTLVGEVVGLLDLAELSRGLLIAVREAVPSDWSALNEIPADRPGAISLTEPGVPPAGREAFERLAPTNPIAAYFLRTRDGRATRISDVVTRREFHALEVYREVYHQLGVEHQIAFTLSSGTDRILGIALSRTRDDFTDRERDLLNLARPYLIQCYRNALAFGAASRRLSAPALAPLLALGVTRRQAEVLRLIATGHTTPQAAAALGIAPRTAQKHLELAYRTIGVSDRSSASRLVWTAVGSG